MKKGFIILALCLAILTLPVKSQAAPSLEVVFMDSLWGLGIGAMVGAATLAFVDNPHDHYKNIWQGASIGMVCGLGYGIFEISPVFYSYTTPAGQKENVYGLTVNMPL